VHDRVIGTTVLASQATGMDGAMGNEASFRAPISADRSLVAFASEPTALIVLVMVSGIASPFSPLIFILISIWFTGFRPGTSRKTLFRSSETRTLLIATSSRPFAFGSLTLKSGEP